MMSHNHDSICTEIIGQLPALQSTFMSVTQLYNAISEGRLVPRPSFTTDDRLFEEAYPEHPLAASNRFTRIDAADRIMNLAREYGRSLPSEVLEVLHRCLFDCSAAVRQSLAGALFYGGEANSVEALTLLLDLEKDSPAVRLRARAALERLSSPYTYPDHCPHVVVVVDHILLVEKLMQLANREGFALRHARPDTPDVIAFGAHVKIIDPQVLGNQAWDDFCDYLAEVNNPEGEHSGFDKVAADKALITDNTPLIIIQDNPNRMIYNKPVTTGPVLYAPAWNDDFICRMVLEYTQIPQPVLNVAAVGHF